MRPAMKAAVYRRYGPPEVVHLDEVARPEPGPREVLIRIRASTVSTGDWRARALEFPEGFGLLGRPVFGFFGPRKPILGTELSGEVAAAGRGVTRFKEGDAVFAFPGFEMGCHAEYRTLPEDGRIAHVPAGFSLEEAAAISFGGNTALYFLRDLAKTRPGQDVLVIGASGAVGSAAVQIARHLGASVTAVTSAANVERIRQLGPDRVIDYTAGPYLDGRERYDVVFDTVGSTSFPACQAALKEGGLLLMSGASLRQIVESRWAARTGTKRVIAGPAAERAEHLQYLERLAALGAYRPLIDRRYALEQVVEAHAYVETGRKRGSVVITIDPAA